MIRKNAESNRVSQVSTAMFGFSRLVVGLRKPGPSLSPVLLAADNPRDARRIRQAMRETRTLNPLRVVRNGQAAIDYLAGSGEFADRGAFPFPILFLLDCKPPQKAGLEVLRWLNEHPEIPGQLPVVVLSSAELPEEPHRAYVLGISACIVKPSPYPKLREKIRILKEYWLDFDAGH